MKDVISKRSSERVDISEPLSGPLMVHIEPTDICTVKCKFCFFQDIEKKRTMMPMENYKKIISGLKELGRLKVINLYMGGESIIHKDIVEMVRLAAEISDKTWIKTNGTTLTVELARELSDAGLSVLTISILGDNDEDYYNLSGKRIIYNDMIKKIQNVYASIKGKTWLHCKIAEYGMGLDRINKFMNDFSAICDHASVEYLYSPAINTTGKDYTLGEHRDIGIQGEPRLDRIVCPFPFYSLIFNADATVVVCCFDHLRSTYLGNITKNTVKEIWNGQKLKEFRIMNLSNNRKNHAFCAHCQHLHFLPDNLDAHMEKIYNRLVREK